MRGICAGAPGPEIGAVLCTPEDIRQFRQGQMLVAAVCAVLLLIELALLPAPRAKLLAGGTAPLGMAAAVGGKH